MKPYDFISILKVTRGYSHTYIPDILCIMQYVFLFNCLSDISDLLKINYLYLMCLANAFMDERILLCFILLLLKECVPCMTFLGLQKLCTTARVMIYYLYYVFFLPFLLVCFK